MEKFKKFFKIIFPTKIVQNDFEDKIYKEIGLFVINFQYLESAFIIIAKLVFKRTVSLEELIKKPINIKAIKQPTKSLLNELKQDINIDENFDTTLSALLEDRHKIIHRLFIEKKWTDAMSIESQKELITYIRNKSIEVNGMSRLFVKYIHEWLEKYPEVKRQLNQIDSDWMKNTPSHIEKMNITLVAQTNPGDL